MHIILGDTCVLVRLLSFCLLVELGFQLLILREQPLIVLADFLGLFYLIFVLCAVLTVCNESNGLFFQLNRLLAQLNGLIFMIQHNRLQLPFLIL